MLFFNTLDPNEQLTSDDHRRGEMLHLLRERTTASLTEIAEKFQVSEMTVRRDIRKLAALGQVLRVPGGARIERPFGGEKSFFDRFQRMGDAKQSIGKAAARLIAEGESVTLGSGTTTLYIARHLRHHRDISVFTFSLGVLEELSASASVRVELTGGTYRRSSHDLVGHAVSESLSAIHTDKVFFSGAALSFRKGVMVNDPEAPRNLLQTANERILVLDSSKIDREARYSYCRFDQCDAIITDSGIQPEALKRLRKLGKVIVAE